MPCNLPSLICQPLHFVTCHHHSVACAAAGVVEQTARAAPAAPLASGICACVWPPHRPPIQHAPAEATGRCLPEPGRVCHWAQPCPERLVAAGVRVWCGVRPLTDSPLALAWQQRSWKGGTRPTPPHLSWRHPVTAGEPAAWLLLVLSLRGFTAGVEPLGVTAGIEPLGVTAGVEPSGVTAGIEPIPQWP